MSIKVMSRVWDHSSQKANQLLMLLAIADRADDDGVCWPGISNLAQKTRISQRQARRNVATLSKSGELYVKYCSGRHNTNLFFVTIGLNDQEIQKILIKRFDIEPNEAKEIAVSIIDLQKKEDIDDPISEEEKEDIDDPFLEEEKEDIDDRKEDIDDRKEDIQGTKKGSSMTPNPSLIHHDPSLIHHEGGDALLSPLPETEEDQKKRSPPAIKIYRKVARLYPDKSTWPTITEAVGESPERLKFWETVIMEYIACGWNKRNVKGMLDFFKENRVPSTKPAGDNHASNKTTITGLQGRAADNPIKKRANIETGETYWENILTGERFSRPPPGMS